MLDVFQSQRDLIRPKRRALAHRREQRGREVGVRKTRDVGVLLREVTQCFRHREKATEKQSKAVADDQSVGVVGDEGAGCAEVQPGPRGGCLFTERVHVRHDVVAQPLLVLGRTVQRVEDPVSAGVAPTGHTTVVEVEARDMRFHPATVDVPAGDRLVIELTNTDDEQVHDLVLDDGSDSGRLSPGESTRLDVGVGGRDVGGWCSVIGHHQMGMAFEVRVVGSAPSAAGR